MADLIRPTKVEIITKDGECSLHITIDLNINLNSIGLDAKTAEKTEAVKEEEKTIWAVPTFKPTEKVKFGKKD